MTDEMTSCSIKKSTLKQLNLHKVVYGMKSHSEAIEKGIKAYSYLKLHHPEEELCFEL